MKHRSLVCMCAGVFTLCLLAASARAQTKLNYSVFFPPTHKNAILAVKWAKEIEKRTGGRVQITVFPSGTLTPADKCYDGVVKGISDIGFSVFAYTRGKFPLTEVSDLPLGIKSGQVATRVINDYYKKFKPREFDEVKVMYLHGHGPGILHTKKPVRKLEDLNGMKIRCTGMAAKIIKVLGGIPVAMPMPDTYDAINRGVVDGSMAPQESLQGWKWGEVVKYTTQNYGASYSTGMFVVMNKKKWESLPPDIQKIIERVNQEWIVKQGRVWDEIDKEGARFTLKSGNKIIPLSKQEDQKWSKAVQPVLDEYVENMKQKGLPGAEVLKFYMETIDKYQKRK